MTPEPIIKENSVQTEEAQPSSAPASGSPAQDKDGWSRWQAWSLMQDLGPHISMGMNPPFETTIRVEVERLNEPSSATG